MLLCWQFDPQQRPTYSTIANVILRLLEDLPPNPSLNNISVSSSTGTPLSTSFEDYSNSPRDVVRLQTPRSSPSGMRIIKIISNRR
jgi:hypothetical protein